jgi:hypothetical protein
MNKLSWLIYLADVAGDLKALLIAVSLLCGIGAFVAWLIAWFEEKPLGIRSSRTLLLIGVTVALPAMFVPRQTTMFAIAASEMGERAIQTPTGDKAIKALDAWLDRQIAGEKSNKADDK